MDTAPGGMGDQQGALFAGKSLTLSFDTHMVMEQDLLETAQLQLVQKTLTCIRTLKDKLFANWNQYYGTTEINLSS